VSYLSATAVVIHYEEALYQVYAPLPYLYLCQFLKDLGRRISAQSCDERESAFLFQSLSVVIQRFNAILPHDSFESAEHLG